MGVDAHGLLTRPEALHAHVRAALAARGAVLRPLPTGARRAAVLLPLVHDAGEAGLLLTKRTDRVEHHKGQISFPGGAVEPGELPLHAALRETHEEVGVNPADVTILGSMDDEEAAVSGFMVSPFVGSIPHPYPFRPNPDEVGALLVAPIRGLLDPQNLRTELWEHRGEPRTIYFFSVGSEVVWGATARIIVRFLEAAFDVAVPLAGGRPRSG